MSVFDRRAMFRGWNADSEHQSIAGLRVGRPSVRGGVHVRACRFCIRSMCNT